MSDSKDQISTPQTIEVHPHGVASRGQLLDEAARCRRLAAGITDDYAQAALMELAADLERRAVEAPDDDAPIVEIIPT